MNPSRVLITGAGGFIGKHLVQAQLGKGRRVRALDRHVDGLAQHASDGLEIMSGDVADENVQARAVDGMDVVFHLASAHLETDLSEREYRRINVTAVETLLRRCHEAGVRRVVHVSSASVHGSVPEGPADEESPYHPDTIYERTKLEGEEAARRVHARCAVPVVIARPTWVYGPGCNRTAKLFRTIAANRFVMVGKGKNARSAIYIDDLLDGLELCATCEGIDGEVFLLTHDELVTVDRVVDTVARLVGTRRRPLRLPLWLGWTAAVSAEAAGRLLRIRPPVTRRSLKFFTNDAAFTCAKATRRLGFKPQVPLQTGLAWTCQWWRAEEGRS